MSKSIRIVIAEDQTMLLGALKALLELEPNIKVVGQAANGAEAKKLIEMEQPDLLISDVEMPQLSGIELAEWVKASEQAVKIIMLTTFARAGYLKRALNAGVQGYLLKDAPTDQLISAINKVMHGRKVIDPELMADAWDNIDPLTEKERKVLQLALQGMTTEAIAEHIHLSAGTVRNYLSNAASKLGANNRIEAARIAKQKGWL